MGYDGQTISIPLGRKGLLTDENESDILPTNLIDSNNIELRKGIIQKEGGSTRWNITALNGSIRSFIDWKPTSVIQSFVAAIDDGKIYTLPDRETITEITATSPAPAILNPNRRTLMITGGNETATKNKKLFIFTGNDPVQVIDGTALTRSNLEKPPSDWLTNPPKFGLFHRSVFIVFGNANDPSRYYISSPTDHEDFTTTPISTSIDPGEGVGLTFAFVYKSKVFFQKSPLLFFRYR